MPEADDAVIAEIDRLLTADPLGLPTCFGERRGERWWRVDGLAETPAVVRWIDEIVTRRDGDRSPADAAAVVTIGRLAHAVVARPAIVFAVQGRALLAGRSLVVQRDPDGPFEAVALRPEPVLVQPSDPLAGTPGTVVADTSTMIAALAAEWSAALGPLVELGRARGGSVVVGSGAASPTRSARRCCGQRNRSAGTSLGSWMRGGPPCTCATTSLHASRRGHCGRG